MKNRGLGSRKGDIVCDRRPGLDVPGKEGEGWGGWGNPAGTLGRKKALVNEIEEKKKDVKGMCS